MNKFNLGDKVCFKSEFNLRDPKPREHEVVGVYQTANGWSYKTDYNTSFQSEGDLILESEARRFFIEKLATKIKEVSQWA